jgi:hypothetical protein
VARLAIHFHSRYGWSLEIDRQTAAGFFRKLPQHLYGGGPLNPDAEGRAAIQRMLREGFRPHTPERIAELIGWWLIGSMGIPKLRPRLASKTSASISYRASYHCIQA